MLVFTLQLSRYCTLQGDLKQNVFYDWEPLFNNLFFGGWLVFGLLRYFTCTQVSYIYLFLQCKAEHQVIGKESTALKAQTCYQYILIAMH